MLAVAWTPRASGDHKPLEISPLAVGNDPLPQATHAALTVDRRERVADPCVPRGVPRRDALTVRLHLHLDQISRAGDGLADDTGRESRDNAFPEREAAVLVFQQDLLAQKLVSASRVSTSNRLFKNRQENVDRWRSLHHDTRP